MTKRLSMLRLGRNHLGLRLFDGRTLSFDLPAGLYLLGTSHLLVRQGLGQLLLDVGVIQLHQNITSAHLLVIHHRQLPDQRR